jgi:hypothetical protein
MAVIMPKTERDGELVTKKTCIPEVLNSYLGVGILTNLIRLFLGPPQFLEANVGIVRSFPPKLRKKFITYAYLQNKTSPVFYLLGHNAM